MMTAVAYQHIEFSAGGVPYINDDFADYWTLHIQRDQQQLPPTGYWWSVNFIDEKWPHPMFDAMVPFILNRGIRGLIENDQCDCLHL
jgi:hypothetical protein